jgi:hypothetical protein
VVQAESEAGVGAVESEANSGGWFDVSSHTRRANTMSASLNDKLEAFFKARPHAWIDGKELANVAGGYGWRSRCSDLRKRGMTVENRQRMKIIHGFMGVSRFKVSEYRYVPDLPTRVEPSGQVAFL